MWEKVSRYVEIHIRLLGGILIITVVVLWLISQLFPTVQNWMQSQNLLNVIAVVLLVDVLSRLVEIKHSTQNRVNIFASQYDDECRANVFGFIRKNKPKKIDLIEYSTATITDILLELSKIDCSVRLLIQHPDMAVSETQRNRINVYIEELFQRVFKNCEPGKIQVRCYCVSASIRGRNFDNKLVLIGWYTYSADPLTGQTSINGDTNSIVSSYVNNTEGEFLLRMFNNAFNDLWEHPTTVAITSPPSKAPIPSPKFPKIL